MSAIKAAPKRGKKFDLSPSKALKMWRNVGGKPTTFYSCAVIDRAIRDRVGVITVDAEGNEFVIEPRRVHRPDLTGVYSEAPSLVESGKAGEGKYIDQKAINGKVVTGGHLVNPYLADERCNATFVETCHHAIGINKLRNRKADIRQNPTDGEHLVWRGSEVTSPWYTQEELWKLACEQNPKLVSWLRQVESGKKGVKVHAKPKEKFFHNIGVMRRARQTTNAATGEVTVGGGATPYAMALAGCGFCIDMHFLTDGFEVVDGEVIETGQYYFRFVHGRANPSILYRRDWRGLNTNSRFAYKDEAIRQRILAARKKAAA